MYMGTYLNLAGEKTVDANAIGIDKHSVQIQVLKTVLTYRYPKLTKREINVLIEDALSTSSPQHFLAQVDAEVIEVKPSVIAKILKLKGTNQ